MADSLIYEANKRDSAHLFILLKTEIQELAAQREELGLPAVGGNPSTGPGRLRRRGRP